MSTPAEFGLFLVFQLGSVSDACHRGGRVFIFAWDPEYVINASLIFKKQLSWFLKLTGCPGGRNPKFDGLEFQRVNLSVDVVL